MGTRGDPVVLHEQALAEDLLERPPHRLHVLRVHGAVRVVQVDPVAHPGRQLGEGVGVPGHRGAALRVELRDAVILDVLLAGEAQLLLHRQLDRQAVAVPAGLAGHMVALHRLEAREDVLEDPGLDVVGAGHTVGGGRALVEDPVGQAARLLDRAGERLALVPQRQHLVFEGGQVDLRGHLAILRLAVRAHRGLPPADTGTDSVEGTRTPTRRRSRGTTLLGGGGLPTAPSLGSAMPVLLARGLSSDGSGLIFTPRTPPGFHRPQVAHGCVRRYWSHPRRFAAAQCTAAGGGASPRFRAAAAGGPAEPNGLLRAPWRRSSRIVTARYRNTRRSAGHNGCRPVRPAFSRAAGSASQCPVAAGPERTARSGCDPRTGSQR